MQFQVGNVLLQFTSQYDLGSVFPLGTVVHQQKICMPIVEHSQFGAASINGEHTPKKNDKIHFYAD